MKQQDPHSATSTVTLASPEADLELAMSLGTNPVEVGDEVVIMLTVYNTGPQTATGVVVHFSLPTGLDFVAAEQSNGEATYDTTTGRWNVGTISKDMLTPVPHVTLQITAQPAIASSYALSAEVLASDKPDPDSTPANNDPGEDDYADATLVVGSASEVDLQVDKRADKPTVSPGEVLTYTLTYANAGKPVSGVLLEEMLPAHTSFNADASTMGWIMQDGRYTLLLGDLETGEGHAVTFSVLLNADVPSNVTITENQVTIRDDGLNGPDSNEQNNEATVVTTITHPAQADLSMFLATSNVLPLAGENTTFSFTIINSGPDAASGVEVHALLPQGLTYVSDSGSGAYEATRGRWDVGEVEANTSRTLDVTATVNIAGLITVISEVRAASSSDPDSVPGNNNAGEDDFDSVTVEAQLMSPRLLAPEEGSEQPTGDLRLMWEVVPGAEAYTVQLDTAGTTTQFDVPLINETVANQTDLQVDTLRSEITYLWRVRATSTGLQTPGPWSAVRRLPILLGR